VDELVKNKLELEVLTDSGWSKFDGVVLKGESVTALLQLEIDSVILTLSHGIYISDKTKIEARHLKPGQKVKTTRGLQRVVSITLQEPEKVYDLLNVERNNRFYANNILSSNCQFIIADETLINPNTLFDLAGREPLLRQGQIRWYKKPTKGNTYTVSLDPSTGTGGDPAAIQIFEANTTTQIGEWKHNKTDIPNQIRLISEVTKFIEECTSEPNKIYYSLENNGIGEAALLSLSEFGEQNIPGIFISERGAKRRGFNVNRKTKAAACIKFKTLLESKKLTVNSIGLVSELKSFVASGEGYKAKSGDTDDLVMSTLLAVRMMQEIGNYDSDLDGQMSDFDDYIAPLPFFASVRF
jgi:hypothetical protein